MNPHIPAVMVRTMAEAVAMARCFIAPLLSRWQARAVLAMSPAFTPAKGPPHQLDARWHPPREVPGVGP